MDAAIAATPLSTWKEYLTFGWLNAYSGYLPSTFVNAQFQFFGGVIGGREENRPRWKRGVSAVEDAVGEPVGRLYIEQHFKPEAKSRVDELVRNLLAAFKVGIDELEWMSPATKAQAQAKLAQVLAEDRISRQMARLRGTAGQRRRHRGERHAVSAISARRNVGASRKAGRAMALGHVPADRQCAIQLAQQRNHLSCGHPSTAILQCRCRRCGELRGDWGGDWPRDQPRVRRSRAQVGWRRQSPRLVDAGRRTRVRRTRHQTRRPVRICTRRCRA